MACWCGRNINLTLASGFSLRKFSRRARTGSHSRHAKIPFSTMNTQNIIDNQVVAIAKGLLLALVVLGFFFFLLLSFRPSFCSTFHHIVSSFSKHLHFVADKILRIHSSEPSKYCVTFVSSGFAVCKLSPTDEANFIFRYRNHLRLSAFSAV